MEEKPPISDKDTFPLPFIEGVPISTDGAFTTVYESPIDPNYVIKDYGWVNDFEAYEKIDELKNQHKLLQRHFDKSIPQSSFVLTREPETSPTPDTAKLKEIKIVQERIFEDTCLDDSLAAQRRQEIESFILNSLNVFESTYKPEEDSGVCVDVTKNNLIFGHTFSDTSPRLYLVDSVQSIRPVSRLKAKETFTEAIRDLKVDSAVISEKMNLVFKDLEN